jgi:hypothetical protein
MANTMKAIQTVTVTGSAGDVQFTNIPQTYTDLYLTVTSAGRLTSGATGALVIYTASGQSSSLSTWVDARGVNANTNSSTSAYPIVGELNYQSSTNNFGLTSIYIPTYTSSTLKKIFITDSVTELAATEATKSFNSLTIDYTSPITFIGLGDGSAGGGIKVGSTVTLYGIKNS